jgi:hypothetical protein
MNPITEMGPEELAEYTNALAVAVESLLPPGTLFAVLFTDPDSMQMQYVANTGHAGMVAAIRETADRIETNRRAKERRN